MAVPTAPSLTTICQEALKKAGYATIPTALQTRAEQKWMEEIKNYISMRGTRLKSLQTEAVSILTKGQGSYSEPYYFETGIWMELMSWGSGNTGTCTDGGSSSVTLASGTGDTSLIGKYVVMTSGNSQGSYSQVTGVSGDVASVTPDFETAPTNGETYAFVQSFSPITEASQDALNDYTDKTMLGKPYIFISRGDSDYGEFDLYPVPDASTYAVRRRYYLELSLLDLTSTRLATFYRRWLNVLIQGVYAKALQAKDDSGWERQWEQFKEDARIMLGRESEWSKRQNLQMTIAEGY